MAEKGTYTEAGSIIREGLIYREVNILKRWITNSEREERRLNFVIKEINIEEESKDKEKKQRSREIWIKEWIKEKSEIECNIVAIRESGSVYVVKVESKEEKKDIMKNKYKLKGGRIQKMT